MLTKSAIEPQPKTGEFDIFTLYFSKIHFNIIFYLHGEFDTFTPYVSKIYFNIIFKLSH